MKVIRRISLDTLPGLHVMPARPIIYSAIAATLVFPVRQVAALPDTASFDVTGATSTPMAVAQNAGRTEEVVVFGRGEVLIGKAAAASEGAVGGADLSVRPLLRVAELLEVVPGLIAAQHSGSGKANQYFLRGFNLDHGTDFAACVDDVPWNLRTHGHGQGYLDVNGLIPETVDRIAYRKGTYRADLGDFSMAGAALMTTVDRLERPFVAVEGGQYGWGRVAGGGTAAIGNGSLTLLGQWKTYDGPWQLAENLQHESLWGKYVQPTDSGILRISVSGYRATWRPTEQIPESVIGTAICANEFCALDKTARGETTRWMSSAKLLGDDWRATVYAQYYRWRMSSNPTYDFQIEQFDRRWTAGGRYERSAVQTDNLDVTLGTEPRYDSIGNVGVDHTNAGAWLNNIARNQVREASIGVYGEATWKPGDVLRLSAGLRGDYYDFDVGAKSAIDSDTRGHVSDGSVSPKLGVAYALTRAVELYGNWGRGFHSNDARGVVKKEVQVDGLATGTGYEGGARFEIGDFKLAAAYWWLDLSSELIFVGDNNSVEPRGASRRHGFELVGFWRALDGLAIDAVYTGSRARYVENMDGGHHVEGSVASAGEVGISAVKGRWEISGRLRFLGPYALVRDNSERASPETMLNLRGAYTFRQVTVYGELLNVMNKHGKDAVYFYENKFDPDGGRVSRAEEPRTLRWGLKYEF